MDGTPRRQHRELTPSARAPVVALTAGLPGRHRHARSALPNVNSGAGHQGWRTLVPPGGPADPEPLGSASFGGGLVLLHHAGRDTPARTDRDAVIVGPGPDIAAARPARRRAARPPG